MPRPLMHDATEAPGFVPAPPRVRYLIVRESDVWFIKFDGEQFGPYKSEREAMLFAVDAAHSLGTQGEPTEVLLVDEAGDLQPVWTYGQDPYPPKQ